MMNSSIIKIFEKTFRELFTYINLENKFMCEVPASSMDSSEKLNTLVSVSGDMEGNIMFGYTADIAKNIIAKMQGVTNVDLIDLFAKGALVDFFAEFCKLFIKNLLKESAFRSAEDPTETKINNLTSSNPIYIAGEDMYGVISKVPSKKLFFKVNGEKFSIAYYLE